MKLEASLMLLASAGYFTPRTQRWTEHFKFVGTSLIELTPEGRTTIKLLQINSEEQCAERQRLSNSLP
jgi:hypothetical protein